MHPIISTPSRWRSSLFTDKFVEIRVQTTAVHFGSVVLFELFFDSESVWVVQAGYHDQQIALETCQVVYASWFVCSLQYS